MQSIRSRTLWLVTGLLLLGVLLIAFTNYRDSTREIGEIYDAHLAQNARMLQGIMSMPVAQVERRQLYQAFNDALSRVEEGKGVSHPYESKMAFQVWNEDGAVLVHSASAPNFTEPLREPGFHDVPIEGRVWTGFLLPDPEHGLLIWVGERDDVRQDLVQRIMGHTLAANFIGTLLLATLIWIAVGWGLKPLQRMAATLRSRRAESLEPLQLTPLPKELEPMQAALNRLLLQVEQMMQRERRFIADAAHEMRTPLAILRLHAQNALAAEGEPERIEALQFLVSSVDRLTRVVAQLLTLARMEPSRVRENWQLVAVDKVTRDTLAELAPWLFGKGLELDLQVAAADYRVQGDAASLGIALQNLVTNAANFSPEGGEIRVCLEREGNLIRLQVEDQGPGVDEEKIERLFERFYSENNPSGAGLGLSIVSMIARHHNGTITLDNAPHGGARAVLTLPCEA